MFVLCRTLHGGENHFPTTYYWTGEIGRYRRVERTRDPQKACPFTTRQSAYNAASEFPKLRDWRVRRVTT